MLTLGLAAAWSVMAGAWLAAHVGLGPWVRSARLDPSAEPLRSPLRIVVPARDEAARIGPCAKAIRALAPGPWAAVVVDDASSDATAAVARAAFDGDPRTIVTRVPERPDGWAGKPWACAHGAVGEEPWLLFVDADVRLDPRAPATMVSLAEAGGLDLLSVFGTWEIGGFGEALVVPAFGWTIRGAVDPRAVRAGRQAFANGQCLLVRRTLYERLGGHAAVAASILDDVDLARAALAAGGRLDVRWAPWAFVVRPYSSLRGALRGHHKNLHVGLGRGVVVSVTAGAAAVAMGMGPLALALVAAALGELVVAWAAVATVGAQVALRARLDRLDGRRLSAATLTHPLGLALFGVTLAASALAPRASWRGRSYVGGRADTRRPPPG